MRRVVLLSVLASSLAFGQSADVTGPELLSGNADEKLQAAAREAKANNRKLVISAPEYWHDMVLEQIRRAAPDVEVDLRDSFAESVMVRGEAPAPAEPAAEPAPVAEPEPAATPAPPARAATPQPAPKPAAPPARPAPTPASAQPPVVRTAPTPAPAQPAAAQPAPTPRPETPSPATVQQPAPAATPRPEPPVAATPAPRATPAPAAAAPVATPAPSAVPPQPAAAQPTRSADAEVALIRRRLEQNLNAGERVEQALTQEELEVNDVIYVEGPVRAVLRRGSLRNSLYWLEGDLELRRVELKELAGDRYQVSKRIRGSDNVVLRATRSAETDELTAGDPSSAPQERQTLERRYNGGKPITATIAPSELEQKDLLYLGDQLVVVVRLEGKQLERYWLVGTINLGRRELIRDGNNKYKVLADIPD